MIRLLYYTLHKKIIYASKLTKTSNEDHKSVILTALILPNVNTRFTYFTSLHANPLKTSSFYPRFYSHESCYSRSS